MAPDIPVRRPKVKRHEKSLMRIAYRANGRSLPGGEPSGSAGSPQEWSSRERHLLVRFHPVRTDPRDRLRAVRLDPPSVAVTADEGVRHPFRLVPDKGMVSSCSRVWSWSHPHMTSGPPQAGHAVGPRLMTAFSGRRTGLPASSVSSRSASSAGTTSRPRPGAVPTSFTRLMMPHETSCKGRACTLENGTSRAPRLLPPTT